MNSDSFGSNSSENFIVCPSRFHWGSGLISPVAGFHISGVLSPLARMENSPLALDIFVFTIKYIEASSQTRAMHLKFFAADMTGSIFRSVRARKADTSGYSVPLPTFRGFLELSDPHISFTSFAYSASSSDSDGLPIGRIPHTAMPASSIFFTALSVFKVGLISSASENTEYFTPEGATILPSDIFMESSKSFGEQKSK